MLKQNTWSILQECLTQITDNFCIHLFVLWLSLKWTLLNKWPVLFVSTQGLQYNCLFFLTLFFTSMLQKEKKEQVKMSLSQMSPNHFLHFSLSLSFTHSPQHISLVSKSVLPFKVANSYKSFSICNQNILLGWPKTLIY